MPDQKAPSCKLVQILGETVHPGEHVTLDLQVARLYTRTTVEIPVVIRRAERDGPVLLLLAAIGVLLATLRSRAKVADNPDASLTAAEQARLQTMLDKSERDS